MRVWMLGRAAVGAVAACFAISLAAHAQTPPSPYYPPPPTAAPVAPASPASDIAACICLRRDMDALGGNMSAKRHAYDEVRAQLDRLDARLARERSTLDVNNADALARFRRLLGERDVMFRRSTGPVAADLSSATARYNDTVSRYNARCANQPQNPALIEQVRSTLACPAPY